MLNHMNRQVEGELEFCLRESFTTNSDDPVLLVAFSNYPSLIYIYILIMSASFTKMVLSIV